MNCMLIHQEQRQMRSRKDLIVEAPSANNSKLKDQRCESEVIQEIVEEVWRKFPCRVSSIAKDFVGIDRDVEDILSYMGAEADDVRIVGICGMGGIGKTTIARVVFERLSCQFEGSSFLGNVRETEEKLGLVPLQKQILAEILKEKNPRVWDDYGGSNEIKNRLCHKRVLVILDDVNRLEQLKRLAGWHDWFGNGSRIVITCRDEHLLTSHGVDKIHRVKELSHGDALRLFSLKAFKNEYPAEEYKELSNHFVHYANGLPLALEVIGSFLMGRSLKEWTSALNRLKQVPNKATLDQLQLSFDELEETEKCIFLDIACFFKGKNKDYVMNILECCGLYADIGIIVLIDKSLISISENKVGMHDLLQEMGQQVVIQRSRDEPGKRTRLWHYKDVYHVFEKNTATEEVEGIVVDKTKQGGGSLNSKAFLNMTRLRLLKLKDFNITEPLEYLSDELQYLEWYGYPFKSLPQTFHPDKLVQLNMRHSRIQKLWKDIRPMETLKFLDLSHSQNLVKTPDFRGCPNLERLALEGCSKLLEVHQSIGVLRRLVSINLKDCKILVDLPMTICDVKSLKILNLSGCSLVHKLPGRLGDITGLEELYLGGTAVRRLPFSVSHSNSLLVFSLHGYRRPQHKSRKLFFSRMLPRNNPNPVSMMLPSLLEFRHLRNLDLSNCDIVEGAIPYDISCIVTLEELNLSGNNLVSIPTSIIRLSNLKVLLVNQCTRLEFLPELPPAIQYVSMHDFTSLKALPDPSIACVFTKCYNLTELQDSNGDVLLLSLKRLLLGLKKMSQEVEFFIMDLREEEVPAWFNFLGVGSKVRILLPPLWCDANWKGFVVCARFAVKKHAVECDDFCSGNDNDEPEILQIECCIHPGVEKFASRGLPLMFSRKGFPMSDMCWILYIPQNWFQGGVDWWNKCRHVDVLFYSKEFEIKICGGRLLYEQDLEEVVPNNIWSEHVGSCRIDMACRSQSISS